MSIFCILSHQCCRSGQLTISNHLFNHIQLQIMQKLCICLNNHIFKQFIKKLPFPWDILCFLRYHSHLKIQCQTHANTTKQLLILVNDNRHFLKFFTSEKKINIRRNHIYIRPDIRKTKIVNAIIQVFQIIKRICRHYFYFFLYRKTVAKYMFQKKQ